MSCAPFSAAVLHQAEFTVLCFKDWSIKKQLAVGRYQTSTRHSNDESDHVGIKIHTQDSQGFLNGEMRFDLELKITGIAYSTDDLRLAAWKRSFRSGEIDNKILYWIDIRISLRFLSSIHKMLRAWIDY